MPKRPRSPAQQSPKELFLSLSRILTGFSELELLGTGMLDPHYQTVPRIVGDVIFGRLLSRWRSIHVRGFGDEEFTEELVRDELLADDDLAPLARNVASLWYLGIWNQLPADWRDRHGASANDVTFIVSPQAYVESLVWKAMHTHPPAAKQPGYGSWALPPEKGKARP